MGLGLFRVWTELNYISKPVAFPLQAEYSYLVFDLLTAVVLVCVALLSRRLAPLFKRPLVMPVTAALLIVCTCLNFASLIVPWDPFSFASWAAMGIGAVGTALFLMLWSEFFGCLNPLRVALYYSASIVLGAVVAWIMSDLATSTLFLVTAALPVVLMLCLWRSYATLTAMDLPEAPTQRFSFPWKPALVVALYVFANGMQLSLSSGVLGTNANIGALVGAAIVYVGIAARRDDFDFSLIWKIAMPAMLVSFVTMSLGVPFGGDIASVFSSTGYTMLLILMMAILSNLSYRYGICALWLFSIERTVRLVSNQAGHLVGDFFNETTFLSPEVSWALSGVLFMALILGATLFFLSEKHLSSSWGVVLKQPLSHDIGLALEKSRLGVRCHELARNADLTSREEEVLLLLFQRKKLAEISKRLCIEKSTVKTHSKHIYQKLDVHSRAELLALVGVSAVPQWTDEREAAK